MGVCSRHIPAIVRRRVMDRRRGSVLVMVLWVLVLVAFLAAQHVAHNRQKAALAIDAVRRIDQEQRVRSIVEIFSMPQPVVLPQEGKTRWMVIQIHGADTWVRFDSEEKRVRVDVGNEGKLRDLVRNILERRESDRSEKERNQAADELVDALLDWMDADDLIRLNGAEADAYIEAGKSYVPSDTPFRTMGEMLLVLGMSETVFWGEPLSMLLEDLGRMAEAAGLRWDGADEVLDMRRREGDGRPSRLEVERPEPIPDFWDAVTVYGKGVYRLTLIGREETGGSWMRVVFLKSGDVGGGRRQVVEEIDLRFAQSVWEPLLDNLIEAESGLRNPLFKRFSPYEK